MPLIDTDGMCLGTLCVIDHKSKTLSELQKRQLNLVAQQVIFLIQSRIEVIRKNEYYSSLEKLVKELPGFIFTYQLDSNGSDSFPYTSQNIFQIFELNSKEVKFNTKKFFSVIHPEDYNDFMESLNESKNNLSLWHKEFRVILPSSNEKWLQIVSNPEKKDNGSILWHGHIIDITLQKKQDLALKHSSKMAALGEMAAGIAHEINNPLAIIKLASEQTLNSMGKNEENIERNIKMISRTIDRISKIIQGLKFFAGQSSSNQIEQVSISHIIEETIAICIEKFKIHNVQLDFNFNQKNEKDIIECRSVEISQVLLNLLNNAFDATAQFKSRWVSIDLQILSETVLITIIDCGLGISKNDAKKCLTPFYTTKTAGKGTGLGLSIAVQIIESHNGKIWIDTESKNTTFHIEIPKTQSSNVSFKKVS